MTEVGVATSIIEIEPVVAERGLFFTKWNDFASLEVTHKVDLIRDKRPSLLMSHVKLEVICTSVMVANRHGQLCCKVSQLLHRENSVLKSHSMLDRWQGIIDQKVTTGKRINRVLSVGAEKFEAPWRFLRREAEDERFLTRLMLS